MAKEDTDTRWKAMPENARRENNTIFQQNSKLNILSLFASSPTLSIGILEALLQGEKPKTGNDWGQADFEDYFDSLRSRVQEEFRIQSNFLYYSRKRTEEC